jgi:hypothetical protein
MFLFDHQGCCYWYAVWDSQNAEAAHAEPHQQDVEVYVLFGGQEFELGRTAYLTSHNFWQFLTDYAAKSKEERVFH